MLCLIILFFLLASLCVGILIDEKYNLSFVTYKMPLGFFIIVGLYQVITIPLLLFPFNLSWLYLTTGIYLLALLFLIYRNIKKVINYIKEISNHKEFFVCLCFSAILIVLYTRLNNLNTLSDFNFYIPLVGSNNHGGVINSIDPWSGIESNLSWMYHFQSYYLLLSSISFLFKINELLLMLWLPSSLFFIFLPFITFDMIHYFGSEIHVKYNYIVYFIVFFLTQLDLFFIEFPYYGNNFRGYVFLYILMVINAYLESYDLKLRWCVILLIFSHFAFQSTALFMTIIILLGLIIYDNWKYKSSHLVFSLYLTIPIFLYGFEIIFMTSQILAFSLLFIYVLVLWGLKKLMGSNINIVSFLIRGGALLFTVIVYAVSIFMSINNDGLFHQFLEFCKSVLSYFSVSNHRMMIDYFQVILLGLLIFGFVFNLFRKRKDISFIEFLPVLTIALFVNPFVYLFVKTYLTGIVYERTLLLIYSMITVIISLKYLMDFFKTKKMIFYTILILSAILFGINMKQDRLDEKIFSSADSEQYDFIYKLPKDLVDVTNFLESYVDSYYEGEYTPSILSSDLRIRLLYNKNLLLYSVREYRHSTTLDEANHNYWLTYLYKLITESGSSYFIQADLSHIADIFRSYPIEYIMTPRDISVNLEQTLDSFCYWIYGNESYRLYRVRLDIE